jgi:hypothetical protein
MGTWAWLVALVRAWPVSDDVDDGGTAQLVMADVAIAA